MLYQIAVSSTADLPRSYLDAHHLAMIPYSYTLNDSVYEDDCRDETRLSLYHQMRSGAKPTTAMINEYRYHEFFSTLAEKNQDILFLDMSQKMSSSYAASLRAAEAFRKEHPQLRLTIPDTRCISGGLGYLVKQVVQRAEAGMSYDELIKFVEDFKLHVAHRFTVDDLSYLKAGGRVSNTAALLGTMLGVKPVLYVPDAGTLDVAEKVHGRKKALRTLIKSIEADLAEIGPAGETVDILHADCEEDAILVRDKLKEDLPTLGAVNISGLGVIIGAHCGPGLLTVFYRCAKRRE